MSDTPKLKPCPFCKERNELALHHKRGEYGLWLWVACNMCGSEGPKRNSEVTAIHAWGASNIPLEALTRIAGIKADDGDDYSEWDDAIIIRCEITAADLKAVRSAINGA